jgi:hypothetical protein
MSNVPNVQNASVTSTKSKHMRGNSFVPSSITIDDLKSDPLLQNNEKLLLKFLKHDSKVFEYASERLKNDKDFLLEAVKQNYIVLIRIPRQMINKEIALAAVKQNYGILTLIPRELIDRDIAFVSLIMDYRALEYIPKELIDRDLVLALVKEKGLLLKHFNKYQNDPGIALEAIEQNPRALEFASDEIKDNLDIVVPAIVKLPHALHFASDRLKNDQGVVLTAIKKSGYSISYASPELQINIPFLINAININNNVIPHLGGKSKKIINENKELEKLYWKAYRNVYESSRRRMDENLLKQDKEEWQRLVEQQTRQNPRLKIFGGTIKKTKKKLKKNKKTKRFRDKR